MHTFDEDAVAVARRGREHGEAPTAAPASSQHDVVGLQHRIGNTAMVQLLREQDADPHRLEAVRSAGGSPLDTGTRVQMEAAIGADFSDVRVHTDATADASARSLGAHAYTAGNDIVFASGRYDPTSTGGQHTLAHELTHVVQQRSGPVDGTDTGTGVMISDPSDRFERAAEANADRVVSAQTSADPVQREADEDDSD